MRITGILSALLFALFLISSASAYTYLNIYIDESGNTEFLGESDSLPILPKGVEINEGKIRGFTSELTSKSQEVWTFSYSLEDSEMNIILPKNTLIKNTSASEIYLTRNKLTLYSIEDIVVEYELENNSSNSSFIVITIILLILFVWIYLNKRYFKKRKDNKFNRISKLKKIDIIKSVLNDRENKILEKLKETGEIKMSYLRKMIDIPKASFSRHIQELEKKNLIKRFGEGKNKFIELIR